MGLELQLRESHAGHDPVAVEQKDHLPALPARGPFQMSRLQGEGGASEAQ